MSTNEPRLCGARNGSYSCQFELAEGVRHTGMHYAYYIAAGRAYVAEWIDHFSQVRGRKAPVPELRRR